MIAHDREHPGEGETAVVPKVPTEGMLRAGKEALWAQLLPGVHAPKHGVKVTIWPAGCETDALIAYRAMLSAAPALHPGATGESVVRHADLIAAYEAEIKRVSTLEYNSNAICRHFFMKVMERLAAAPEPPSQPGAGWEEGLPEPSRTGIADAKGRMVQRMCDAIRRSSGSSPCELCDEPCDDPAAIECAAVALPMLLLTPSPSSGDRAEGPVSRPSDMDPSMSLRLVQQDDGDVIVSIGPAGHRISDAEVEFCTSNGGTASPYTRAALCTLMAAMRADEMRRPITLPARNEAGALASSGGGEEGCAICGARHATVDAAELCCGQDFPDRGSPTLPVAASEDVRDEVWQPIENTPDGHFPVLVYAPEFGTAVGFLDACKTWWPVPAIAPFEVVPTHWAPLITPPGAGQRSAEGEGK